MNILMVTNTYLPFGGGVARSVAAFSRSFRGRGHPVLVVAPEVQDHTDTEEGVVRVPSVHRPLKRPFAVALPVPGLLTREVRRFEPTVVHSHHPFLLGDDALRIAASHSVPLVFTHHTQYEQYVLALWGRAEGVARFVMRLATAYANLCQRVVAPSESVAEMLRSRGVEPPIAVIPTGVDTARFAQGEGAAMRQRLDIPREAFLAGYVGRLAEEKNLAFLGRAVAEFLNRRGEARFLVVGDGDAEDALIEPLRSGGVEGRVHRAGHLEGRDLVDAYHALDVLAFASKSETQGMVLAESMAAGVPVVALEAPGVREIVRHDRNGLLVAREDEARFAAALEEFADRDEEGRRDLARRARETADRYSLEASAESMLALYEEARESAPLEREIESSRWVRLRRSLEAEWDLLTAGADAAAEALREAFHGD